MNKSVFFVITPPGFENESLRETQEVWPFLLNSAAKRSLLPMPEVQLHEGGLEFECDLILGLQLNFFLKTASRILLRLSEFRARDFPKMFEKLTPQIRLLPEGDLDLRVTARESRLGHEGRVKETALAAWKRKAANPGEGYRLHLRGVQDQWVLSLDTSGNHLHKRGQHQEVGEAPLRENVAAFLVRKMMDGVVPGELRQIELIDPMAGSGHILTEAMSLWQPSIRREFAFQKLKQTPKLLRSTDFEKNYGISWGTPFKQYFACDNDPQMLPLLRAHEKKGDSLFKANLVDLFSEKGKSFEPKKWIICNPPYGIRLKGPSAQSVLDQVIQKYQPQRVGLLLPEDQGRQLHWPDGWARISEVPLTNGGIRCRFVIRERVMLSA